MFKVYAILAVIALVGGGSWAIIAKMNRDATRIAQYEIRAKADAGVIVGLKVSNHEKSLNNAALRRANNTISRTTRDAKQSSIEGLNDDTHTDATYDASFNRAWAASLNGVQGGTNRNNQPDSQ